MPIRTKLVPIKNAFKNGPNMIKLLIIVNAEHFKEKRKREKETMKIAQAVNK